MSRFIDRIRFLFNNNIGQLIWQPSAARQLSLPDMTGQVVGQSLSTTQTLTAGSTIAVPANTPKACIPISSAAAVTVGGIPALQTAGVADCTEAILFNVGSFPITIPTGSSINGLFATPILPGEWARFTFLALTNTWYPATTLSKERGTYAIHKDNTQYSRTGVTTEGLLTSFAIPGGLLQANDWLDIEYLAGFTGNTNSKTMRLRVGPTAGITGTVISQLTFAANAQSARVKVPLMILSDTTQRGLATGFSNYTNFNAGVANYSFDLRQPQIVSVTAQLAIATDTANVFAIQAIAR